MRRFVHCTSMLILFLALPRARAQDAEEFLRGNLPPGVTIVDGQLVATGDQRPPEGAGEQKGNARLEKLKKLEFDRRPSTILKAWSTPPPEPPKAGDEPGEETKPAGEKASEDSTEKAEAGEPPERETSEPNTEDEASAAEKEAEAARQKAKQEAERKARESALLQAELQLFQRQVTLGEWDKVKAYLAGLDENEAKVGYEQMIRSLKQGPKAARQNPQQALFAEKNVFSFTDVISLADTSPIALDDKMLNSLGSILRQCLDGGNNLDYFIALARTSLSGEYQSASFPLTKRQTARLLFNAGEAVAAGEFLPPAEWAETHDDREALNLLARHYMGRYAKERKTEFLEQAWGVTQAALAVGEISDSEKQQALKRAVEIAPKLASELGQAWLDESFTSRPERGMEILATIGSAASLALQKKPSYSDSRYKGLELQNNAANALLRAAPEQAAGWSATLTLLAENWLREAILTYTYDQSTRRGPRLQRDQFGNMFYTSDPYNRSAGNNMPRPIPTGDLLKIRPCEAWLDNVDESLRPRLTTLFAQLLLKVGEEAEAFPYIETLAQSHPDQAKDLVNEFLRVWTRNHNPNQNNNRTNPYMFIYGFDQRASGIPLTRSKQERNLRELAEWVTRLRKLPIDEIDENLLTTAFISSHSTAEVYRLETIEAVFGPLSTQKPATLARLVQRMRSNLVSVWRRPATQKDKKTNRGPKDIQNEVLRGYAVAESVVDQGLEQHPGEWSLVLAKASLQHDENNYLQEIQKNPEFAGRRREALTQFHAAAKLYAKAVSDMAEDDQTSEVYETWFYAALGASDLQAVDQEKQLIAGELDLIRNAITSLGGETADRHMAIFANSLFTRMSSVNPAVKFRYLRAGLQIVGEHERAAEARKIFDYYKDLIGEIVLDTHVDGSGVIGHDRPFGLFVNIRHTREIEREAGGFGKYLVNQNNQSFAYNYGRPTEDYRDKFEQAAREALQENYEILSVTFNHPNAHSIAEEEYGWRYTPYAYILLEARGPEVDTIPSLRLDMDFLDMSGYAIIPIESSPLIVDAKPDRAEERPFNNLQITQTLDERQADKGKLILEVKARANGLVPELDRVIDLAPKGFEITEREDQGASVTEFDEESDDVAVISERTWMITLQGRGDLEKLPETFTFGTPVAGDAKTEYLRYVDADLESVAATIPLQQEYGQKSTDWTWLVLPGGIVVAILGFILIRSRKRTGAVAKSRFEMPESVTPFTIIGLLREIEHNNGLRPADQGRLAGDIERLERFYFLEDRGDEPDLEQVAKSWLTRVS